MKKVGANTKGMGFEGDGGSKKDSEISHLLFTISPNYPIQQIKAPGTLKCGHF